METDTWLEITTLLIPGKNDSTEEITAMSKWIAQELGPDVPLHFSAFHPDYKMTDTPSTPRTTLDRARAIALSAGLHHVYTGNVHDTTGGSTYCPSCKALLIARDWYEIGDYRLTERGLCPDCGARIPGHFEKYSRGFGNRRVPVLVNLREK